MGGQTSTRHRRDKAGAERSFEFSKLKPDVSANQPCESRSSDISFQVPIVTVIGT